jgi:two-component system, chemotaxis family, protein-glutamate methylesterase/glutaminase
VNGKTGQFQVAEVRPKIRVLVVDDSALLRKLVSQAIEADADLEVVGTASNGLMALQCIELLRPDVVTLDVEMPEMDGIETLRRIRVAHPVLRVIMCSTLTERGASVTIEALMLGANDYVRKGGHGISGEPGKAEAAVQALSRDLVPKIKQFFPSRPPTTPATETAPPLPPVQTVQAGQLAAKVASKRTEVPEALVIGVSTGGPTALHEIVPQIPAQFPLPILIVQHMPPLFTRLLAERLATRCALKVEEARDGEPVDGGRIYIAPGDYHMRVTGKPGRVRIALDQGPAENSCRPAVDVLFRSASEVWGPATIAAVLTGMGSDGLEGCRALRRKGAYVLTQDEATSVVWGMPGFVTKAGLADKVLPLGELVPDIVDRCQPAIRGAYQRGTPTAYMAAAKPGGTAGQL